MPPKKRGRPPGPSATASNKRVRVGETSIIGEQGSTETTGSGRSRRTSAGEPNYSTTRAKAPNNVSAASAKTSVAGKVAAEKGRKGVSKQVGKSKPAITAKALANAEANETPKRGRGRPKTLRSEESVDVAEDANRAPKKAVGRPSKTANPAKRTAQIANLAKARAARHHNLNSSVKSLDDENEDDDHTKPHPKATSNAVDDDGEESDRQYWLMKAEPDSRTEKGVDVKFSIDDLRARGVGGEGWDGVRNFAARNNLRAMRKGDLALFYHSNCKVPGVVGIMKIIGEHRVDETAFDAEHPYYDDKSSRDNPKWDLVSVSFVHKFKDIVKLTDLKSFAKTGGALADMQLLRQSRLSVSSVKPKEWNFILDLAGLNPADFEYEEGHTEEDLDGTDEEDVDGVENGKKVHVQDLMDEEAGEVDDGEEDDDDEKSDHGADDDDEVEANGVNGHNKGQED